MTKTNKFQKTFFLLLLFLFPFRILTARQANLPNSDFAVRGFHLDLRIQVMTMSALKDFALKLSKSGINTLIMEWEGTFPFSKHPIIANKYAYSKPDIEAFISYCDGLGIDVIPLQQSFGHVEYILRHYRYARQREDQKDYSQLCPSQEALNRELFTDLYTELVKTHHSKYIHVGGDETYLLGHCPICAKKAAEEGISKLYIDHIKMLCDIIIKLGKRPILWADIALKYPESLSLLPKETIFIDWNYGWDMNRFGDHQKLLNSGFEIWGAPAIRSHPDNYFLTLWDKHARNIRDFVDQARQMGYKGIVLTSWSTSGQYDALHESSSDIFDLYAIRHVYPITGFNMLIAAYSESLKTSGRLDIIHFITSYCKEKYGFNGHQADSFWRALTAAPYEVEQGKVLAKDSLSLENLMDSQINAASILSRLVPLKNKDEFEQYRLMTAIRIQYLAYEQIESRVNSAMFSKEQIPEMIKALKQLILNAGVLDRRFIDLNRSFFHLDELMAENRMRNLKTQLLYEQLSKE